MSLNDEMDAPMPDTWSPPATTTDKRDSLSTFVGILYGVALGSLMWAGIIVGFVWLTR